MSNILKKCVVVVTTLLVLGGLGFANDASALTTEELQAQITALLAQIATLQTQLADMGGTTTTGTTVTGCTVSSFDRALMQGMSGEDVTREEFNALMEAARWAPSEYNDQPWRFLYARSGAEIFNKFYGGYLAGGTASTGMNNIGFGYESMKVVAAGHSNACFGYRTGYAISSGYSNVLVGYNAGVALLTGYNNVSVGSNSSLLSK